MVCRILLCSFVGVLGITHDKRSVQSRNKPRRRKTKGILDRIKVFTCFKLNCLASFCPLYINLIDPKAKRSKFISVLGLIQLNSSKEVHA